MKLQDIQQLVQMFIVERRLLVVAIALAIASLAIGGAAIWPMWQQLQTTSTQIRKLENQVNKNQKRLKIVQNVSEEDQQNFDRVGMALPEYKQPLNYLLIMNDIASRSGVVISEYNLNPGIVSTDSADTTTTSRSVAAGVDAFDFTVTLQGTLDQIKDSFHQLETSLPLMEITQFDLSASTQDDSGIDQYRVILSLVSHYAKLEVKDVAKQTVEPLSDAQQSILDQITTYHLPGENTKVAPKLYDNQNIFGQ